MENKDIVDRMTELGRLIRQRDTQIAHYLDRCVEGLRSYDGELCKARYTDISKIPGVGNSMIRYVMPIIRGEDPADVAKIVTVRRPRKDRRELQSVSERKRRIPNRIPKNLIVHFGLIENVQEAEMQYDD